MHSGIYGTSAKLRFNSTSGEINCEIRLKGTVTTNGFKSDITAAEFWEEGVGAATPSRCKTTIACGFALCWAEYVAELPGHAEAAKGWCLQTIKSGKWSLAGGTCGGAAEKLAFTLRLWTATSGGTQLVDCTYRAEGDKVSGTYLTGTNTLTLAESGNTFKSSTCGFCPAEVKLSGSISLTTNDGKAAVKVEA